MKPSKVSLTCVPAYPCVYTHTHEQYLRGLQTTVPTVARGALLSHPDIGAMGPCAHSPLWGGALGLLVFQHLETV